jgi:hypothetical protein
VRGWLDFPSRSSTGLRLLNIIFEEWGVSTTGTFIVSVRPLLLGFKLLEAAVSDQPAVGLKRYPLMMRIQEDVPVRTNDYTYGIRYLGFGLRLRDVYD